MHLTTFFPGTLRFAWKSTSDGLKIIAIVAIALAIVGVIAVAGEKNGASATEKDVTVKVNGVSGSIAYDVAPESLLFEWTVNPNDDCGITLSGPNRSYSQKVYDAGYYRVMQPIQAGTYTFSTYCQALIGGGNSIDVVKVDIAHAW